MLPGSARLRRNVQWMWPSRLMPVVGRILEFTRPQPGLRCPRLVFVGHIVERVFPKGNCLPLLDHPSADVDAVDGAQAHHAPIAVRIPAYAAYRLAADLTSERLAGIETTRVLMPLLGAALRDFGCIDAPQPNAFIVDLYRVAINNACCTFDDLSTGRAMGQNGKQQQDCNKSHAEILGHGH